MHDIIDNRKEKLIDRIKGILDSSEASHFAVGYFFLSGFTEIADKLTHLKELQLLIGNTINSQTIEQIAQGYQSLELIEDKIEAQKYPKSIEEKEMTRATAANIRSHLEFIEQTDEAELLVQNLVKMIEEKRLHVRVYTKGTLHAKAYIFDYGTVYNKEGIALQRQEKGIAIVGSSNLTLSGITHNTELNVVINGNDNHTGLTNWFNELWDEAEDFNQALMREMKISWAGLPVSPYDVYMKTLYTLVKDRLEDKQSHNEIIIEDEISKLQHAGKNLRGLMRVLLFKRFESSVYAFRETIEKLLVVHQIFLESLNKGFIPAGKEAQTLLSEDYNQAEEEDLMSKLQEASSKYKLSDFDVKRLQQDIKHDIKILEKILVCIGVLTSASIFSATNEAKAQTKTGKNQTCIVKHPKKTIVEVFKQAAGKERTPGALPNGRQVIIFETLQTGDGDGRSKVGVTVQGVPVIWRC